MAKTKITVFDLFSGAGGFSLGFRRSEFNILLAIDVDHAAARTYAFNFPETIVIEDDIRNYLGEELAKIAENTPDVIIGSPPCEPFTAANPLRMKDPLERLYVDSRGNLTLEYIRIVSELHPKVFVMENVPAIVETSELKDAIIHEFKRAGYNQIFFNYLRAEEYGNPSRRLRVFISNIPIKPNRKTIHYVKVWDAISDLMDRTDLPNHQIQELSEDKLKQIANLSFDDYLTMFRGSKRNIPVGIRLNPFDIAPTVLGNSRFIHPFLNRYLTVREQARLMSFPDDHVFFGTRDEQYNQVGEAVPVVLSTVIAQEILRWFYA